MLIFVTAALAQDLRLTFEAVGAEPVTRVVEAASGPLLHETVALDRRTHLDVRVTATLEEERVVYDVEIDEVRTTRRGERRTPVSRPRVVSTLETRASVSQGSIDGDGRQTGGFSLDITPI